MIFMLNVFFTEIEERVPKIKSFSFLGYIELLAEKTENIEIIDIIYFQLIVNLIKIF